MRKGDIRKAQILTVAERLFLSRGYLATTLADILDEVGCTKGSFYHHFDSKYAVLDAIAARRADRAFDAYRQDSAGDGLHKLNRLMYHALPFGREQRDFLAVLIALGDTPEGTLVVRRLIGVLRLRFLPELEQILAEMRAQGTASFGSLPVAELVWDAAMAFVANTLLSIARDAPPTPAQLLPRLNALRFLLERVLDIPYGSVTIISLEEFADTLTYAARKAAASRQEEQQA